MKLPLTSCCRISRGFRRTFTSFDVNVCSRLEVVTPQQPEGKSSSQKQNIAYDKIHEIFQYYVNFSTTYVVGSSNPFRGDKKRKKFLELRFVFLLPGATKEDNLRHSPAKPTTQIRCCTLPKINVK